MRVFYVDSRVLWAKRWPVEVARIPEDVGPALQHGVCPTALWLATAERGLGLHTQLGGVVWIDTQIS